MTDAPLLPNEEDRIKKIRRDDYWSVYDIVDGWYHEHTRHHLVDVDEDVKVIPDLLSLIALHTQQEVDKARLDELNRTFGKDSPKDTDDWYSVPVEYLSKRLDELSAHKEKTE